MNWTISDGVRNALWTPEYFPSLWTYNNDEISFHRFTPESFRSASFLGDPNFIKQHPFVGSVSIGNILSLSETAIKEQVAKHYIFHLAYCCSTLLAKYFEECKSHLVLKEPSVLSSYAVKPLGVPNLDDLRLSAISWLLGRTYADQDVVVIKPNVPANTIAKDLLRLDSTATATFIVHGMEACITSIIKYQWRIDRVRSWNKVIYRKAIERGEEALRPDFLDAVETAAFWWIENMKFASEFASSNSDRALIVTADSIAELPGDVLMRIAGLPGMAQIYGRIPEMTSSDVASRYSKRSEKKYNIEDRKIETVQLLEVYSGEILQAREWLLEHYSGAVAHADDVARGIPKE